MKKVNITTAVLLIYLIVMSIIGWPGKQVDPDYVQYFGGRTEPEAAQHQ